MASIVYIQLANGEPDFTSAPLTDLLAVRQAIQTRLLLFQGEWWENLNDGTPMFQSILGSSGSKTNLSAIANMLSSRIYGTPYVSKVSNVSVTYNKSNRTYSYSADAQTVFGTTTIAGSGIAGGIL